MAQALEGTEPIVGVPAILCATCKRAMVMHEINIWGNAVVEYPCDRCKGPRYKMPLLKMALVEMLP